MITVLKNPDAISFSGNPIRISLQSNAFCSNIGVKGAVQLLFYDKDTTAGHTFVLSFMNQDMIFTTTSGGTNQSGQEIPVASSGMTMSQWISTIGLAFDQNYFLHFYYDIVVGSDIIIITAKYPGTFYSIDFKNINVVHIETGTKVLGEDKTNYPGFGCMVQILDNNGLIIGEDFRTIDATGNVVFDVSSYLLSKIEQFSLPHFSIELLSGNSKIYTDGILRYKLGRCEKYNGQVNRIDIGDEFIAVMGGLSREALNYWNEQDHAYWDDSDNQKRFLTWAPRKKLTSTTQLERLFFIALSGSRVSLIPYIEVVFDDNSTMSYPLAAIALSDISIIELQVGYSELHLDAIQPIKNVVSWKVWLVNGSEPISEVFEFDLDPREREYDRQFIFRNSFGWYDTALFTGKIESDLEYDRSEGYMVTEVVETVYNTPDKALQNIESQTYNGTTGWLKAEIIEWLRDLFLSKEIYEIIDGRCYPVIITVKKVIKCKDMDDKLQLNIEYSRSYKNIYFSTIEPLGNVNGNGNMLQPLTFDSTLVTFDSTQITFDETQY